MHSNMKCAFVKRLPPVHYISTTTTLPVCYEYRGKGNQSTMLSFSHRSNMWLMN